MSDTTSAEGRTVSTSAAARILGITAGGVRKALDEGRLQGAKDRRGHWSVEIPPDVWAEHVQATREAARREQTTAEADREAAQADRLAALVEAIGSLQADAEQAGALSGELNAMRERVEELRDALARAEARADRAEERLHEERQESALVRERLYSLTQRVAAALPPPRETVVHPENDEERGSRIRWPWSRER